ncbi:MAG: N-acetylneuraminic acid (Neu5Ac) synthase [Parcubacteria group bacterium Gr01-1014_33]|nr:MAG: N-acetylneuraminic acid (Neu5Ac) synthase [Parcubacteria group bacterium Gr01-1014_33]
MSQTIKIGDREVGPGKPCFVVAEIGINHNGDIDTARRLIDVAVAAGADAVKFQKRTIPVVYSEEERIKPREVPSHLVVSAIQRGVLSEDARARLTTSNFIDTRNEDQKWALELTKKEYEAIDEYCKEKKILWFASPWDEESVDFLEEFNPPCYKVASASLTDDGLLRYIRSKGRPIILSTGMSTMGQIEHAVEGIGAENCVILHCTSTYPSEAHELNLSVIHTLQKRFPYIPIGYSGHEVGISSSLAAAVLGACMVERHITLDRAMWGSDQAASLEPHGLAQLVKYIRHFEIAKGDGIKRVYESEIPILKKLRRK